jgi:ribonuclease Z
MRLLAVLCVLASLGTVLSTVSRAQSPTSIQTPTSKSQRKLDTTAIVFGVGSPELSAERAGTSIGIVAGGTLYLFDAGPGVERRIMEAGPKLAALDVQRFGPVFITHIHRDHTAGLAALLAYHDIRSGVLRLSLAALKNPLTVYGPDSAGDLPSIGTILDHLRAAFGLGPTNQVPVNAINISPGPVYEDAVLKVRAFAVNHIPNSFGFRIQTADRVIVISGDTTPSDALVEACNGCDLLFHELYGLFEGDGPNGSTHTHATALGEIARRAKPNHLVIYHHVGAPQKQAVEMIEKSFKGKVTFARDLDVF